MQQLGDFFAKFKNLPPPPKVIRQKITDVITQEVGGSLENDAIKIEKTVVFVHAHPVLKSEIAIKKQAILESLASKIPQRKFTDIF